MQIELHGFGPPNDITLTLNGSPQLLVGPNKYRSHIQFQAPAGGNLTYSFTNASCAAGLTGCFTLGAGQTYINGATTPQCSIYVNGTNAQVVVATEC